MSSPPESQPGSPGGLGSPGGPGASANRDRWYEKAPGTLLDRFPVLGDAMVAAAKVWTDSFCALSASSGELAFKTMRPMTVADLLQVVDGTPIVASFRVPAWDSMAALVLGRPLVLTFVEALFGGEGEEGSVASERPVSPVEMRMVDVIGGQAATALTAGLRDFAPTRIEFDRTRPVPDLRFLGKPGTQMLVLSFELKSIGRAIVFHVALPLGAVEANAAVWSGSPSTAPLIDDTLWALQLRAEVVRAAIALKASIGMGSVSLGTIAGWRVGDVLELPPASGSNVLLTCENEMLFRCDLGQSTGMYTVRIGDGASDDHPPSRKDD